ncbi:helix-turn-helix domain-containing protein [Candidatus Falkowbacteria bacterium]|jgi:cytoskeletal protein RodZ|nr:helix-turn-helix domain-containing protein [Candidatus Falkowbacteria bacterium]MBT5502663.1 helix-turn-helix domain-containing protein [Candidatus Falkowbacteria bacterium]MBT6574153.1 helix-turn-helix domain-containing protein [Candidatus Falkowbacteria bacterium]MBT7348700.1 helix-turn-helix domain-containing protein [Candidatus Falkowbacteria bacterium]MBT7500490.1 helix-turn-helix domain-containing protein [Candidatus Falkowbacteria bacterium]
MTGFINKKIETIQTLGERLAKHRKEKGLSRDKAARAININVRYLRYLETNAYGQMPADVYALNIIRAYADLLELNPSTVEDLYKKEKALYSKTQKRIKPIKLSRSQKMLNRFLNPKTLKYSVIIIFIAAILLYIGSEVNTITSSPELIIASPPDNLITQTSQVKIQGQTEKEVHLRINDRPLLSDKNGNFSIVLDLQKGLNIIKISAQKKHSKEKVVYKKVIVTDEQLTEPIQ